MSSTELPVDLSVQKQSAEELASLKAKRISSIAGKIRRARRSITTKMLQIADILASAKEELRVIDREGAEDSRKTQAILRAFANGECSLPKDEIKTFEQLASLEEHERELLVQQGSGYDVLKAIASDRGLRNEVIKRMDADILMDIAAVRRVRLQRKLAAETPLKSYLRRHPEHAIMKSRAGSSAAVKSFERKAAQFVQKLNEFSLLTDLSADDLRTCCKGFSLTAAALASDVCGLVDARDMPTDWVGLSTAYTAGNGFGKVAELLLALSTIAAGDFFIPDEENGGYIDTDDLNIDKRLITAIGELVGAPAGRVKATSKPGSAPRGRSGSIEEELPKLVEPQKFLRSVEICAGAGGQALGLHDAGFRAHAIFEREADAAATLRQHFHGEVDRVFTDDITRVDFSHYRGRVDLVAGGVPCQPYSTAGFQKGEKDERDLFRRAVEIVDEIQPRAFFFENVQGFGRSTFMAYRAELAAEFEALGYQSRLFPIMGSDYGLAQGRPRFAFVGFRDPDAMTRFKAPPAFPEWGSSLLSTIGDLVSANGWKGFADWSQVADERCPTIVGGSRKSDKFSFACGHTRETWRLLGIDSTELGATAPAPDHKGLFRLTLEMGARIQGFPDGWRFQGKKKQIKSQIGNAFPPIMAKAVGLAIHAALENVDFDYEKALCVGFKTPPAPKPKEKPSRRYRDGQIRLNLGSGVPSLENLFFDEVGFDEHTGADVVVAPGEYRRREITA